MRFVKSILVVDDDADIRTIVAKALEGPGRRVEVAEDARDALDLTRTQSFDVVVSDMKMEKETSGLKLLKGFKDINPQIQVILMSTLSLGIFARAGIGPGWAVPVAAAVVGSSMAWLPYLAERFNVWKGPGGVALGSWHTGALIGVAFVAKKIGPKLGGSKKGSKSESLASPVAFGSLLIGGVSLLLALNAGENTTTAVNPGLLRSVRTA